MLKCTVLVMQTMDKIHEISVFAQSVSFSPMAQDAMLYQYCILVHWCTNKSYSCEKILNKRTLLAAPIKRPNLYVLSEYIGTQLVFSRKVLEVAFLFCCTERKRRYIYLHHALLVPGPLFLMYQFCRGSEQSAINWQASPLVKYSPPVTESRVFFCLGMLYHIMEITLVKSLHTTFKLGCF